MDCLYFNERCKQHPEFELDFIKLNNSDSNKSIPFFSCLCCLSQQSSQQSLDFKDYLSIKYLMKCGQDEIIKQWPPIKNISDLLDKLNNKMNKYPHADVIVQQVIKFFVDFKKQINNSIDACQKKMIKIAEQTHYFRDDILKQYQDITQINELRNNLFNNHIDLNMKEKLCSDIISLQQSSFQINSQLLQNILSSNPEQIFNLSDPLLIQSSIINQIESINVFQKYTQEIDVNLMIGRYNNGQECLKLEKDLKNKPMITMIQQSGNDWTNTISNIILDKHRNYIFRLRLDNLQNGHGLYVGLMQDKYIDTLNGYNDDLYCRFQNEFGQISYAGGQGIDEKIYGDECMILSERNEIEIRININQKILHILDYPNYKSKVGLSQDYYNHFIHSDQLRLYLGMHYKKTKVTLFQSFIVAEFQSL